MFKINEKVILIGDSNKTRLMFDFLVNENRIDTVMGIIDNDINKKDNCIFGKKVIGNVDYLMRMKAKYKINAIVSMSENYFHDRQTILEDISEKGFQLANIISNKADISVLSQIGKNLIIFPGCRINGYCILENDITLWSNVLIEHDCIIHNNVDISPRVTIAGEVEINSRTFIGINSTIMPKIKIGKNVIVGAGSVVTRNIPDNAVVVGNPARIIRWNNR